MMPVMSGMLATRKLREMGVRIPIVAVTGNALAEDVVAFRASGVDAVLTKPVDKVALTKLLNDMLRATNVPN